MTFMKLAITLPEMCKYVHKHLLSTDIGIILQLISLLPSLGSSVLTTNLLDIHKYSVLLYRKHKPTAATFTTVCVVYITGLQATVVQCYHEPAAVYMTQYTVIEASINLIMLLVLVSRIPVIKYACWKSEDFVKLSCTAIFHEVNHKMVNMKMGGFAGIL